LHTPRLDAAQAPAATQGASWLRTGPLVAVEDPTMKILLAVDGSDTTKRMLSYLAAHDELLGQGHTHTVLTVVPPVPPHAARFIGQAQLDDYQASEAAAVLAPIRAFVQQQGWAVSFEHRVGPAAQTIAGFAQSGGFDLLVMGTHGHSALGNMVFGSITTGVLARPTPPVLLIR
jgi:nucleotide-binding universal stress UspA family protein